MRGAENHASIHPPYQTIMQSTSPFSSLAIQKYNRYFLLLVINVTFHGDVCHECIKKLNDANLLRRFNLPSHF